MHRFGGVPPTRASRRPGPHNEPTIPVPRAGRTDFATPEARIEAQAESSAEALAETAPIATTPAGAASHPLQHDAVPAAQHSPTEPPSPLDDAYARYCLLPVAPTSTGGFGDEPPSNSRQRWSNVTAVQPVDSAPPRRERRPSLWKLRDWNVLYRGIVVSTAGSFMTSALVPVIATQLAGESATLAGLATGSTMVTAVACMLPAGLLVDRLDRKRVMFVSSIVQFLTFATLFLLMFTHSLNLAWLVILMMFSGAGATFTNVVAGTATRAVVPSTLMADARIANTVQYECGKTVGPAVGTVLFRAVPWLPFLIDALSYLFVVFNTLLLRSSLNVEPPVKGPRPSLRRQVYDGFMYTLNVPIMRLYTLALAAYSLFTYGMPFLLTQHLKANGIPMEELGFIFPAMAVSTLLSTMFLKRLMAVASVWVLAMAGFGGVIVALVCMASSHSLATLALSAALFSASSGIACNPLAAYVMTRVPVDRAGTILSAQTFVQWLPMPLSALLMGWLIDAWSVSTAAIVLAVGIALVTVSVAVSRAVREIGPQETW